MNNIKTIDGYLPYIAFAMWQNDVDKINEYLDLQKKEYGPLTHWDVKKISTYHNMVEEGNGWPFNE